MNDNLTPTPTAVDSQAGRPPDSLKTVAVVVYALQAIGYFVGITALIGVISAHIKSGDAKGTWLESHFRWQIRSYWYSPLWGIMGVLLITGLVGYLLLSV